jgi:hypothetical protein
MSSESTSSFPTDAMIEPHQELRRVAECVNNEQRLERIIQEMWKKAVQCYKIIKEMLILSGFDKEKVNDEVAKTYNILKERDLANLMRVCLSKSWKDPLVKGLLEQKLKEIERLVHAIMELDKSARIIARHVVIDKYLLGNKIRITFTLLGLIVLFYLLQKQHDSTEDHEGDTRKEIPLQITKDASSETV